MRRLVSQPFHSLQLASQQSRCFAVGTTIALFQQHNQGSRNDGYSGGGQQQQQRRGDRGQGGFNRYEGNATSGGYRGGRSVGGTGGGDRGGYGQQGQQEQHQRPYPQRRRQEVGDRNGGGRGGGGGGRGRAPEQYLEQNAQTLVEMKRQFKQARSAKERRGIQQDARRLIRRTRVDASTQDEKSVTILLNAAATFHAAPSEGLEQAVQWMRKNLNGLSPQNIALFANALGVLRVPDGDTILAEEVGPVVQAVVKEMTPVEVVMVLQAFQRERVGGETAALQALLLKQLAPSVKEMPVPQLSTLASVLCRHPIKESDAEAWRGMSDAITAKAFADVENMHSKEAITFLAAAPYMLVEQRQLVQLLRRATTTAGFHTTEQVAELFRAMAAIHRLVQEPTEELTQACDELRSALVLRLDRVAEFATVRDVSAIWKYSRLCGVELPGALQERLVEAAIMDIAWVRQRFPSLARLARAAAEQKLPSPELLNALGDYAVGKRVLRRGKDGQVQPAAAADERTMEEISAARARLYGRRIDTLVLLRLHLERAFSASGADALPETVGKILPEELVRNVGDAAPRQALLAVEHVVDTRMHDDRNRLRNTANDEAIVAAVEARLRADPAAFEECLTSAFVQHSIGAMGDAPLAKTIVELLKALEPKK